MGLQRAFLLAVALGFVTVHVLACCGGMKEMTADELADLTPSKLQKRCDKEDFLACQVLGDVYLNGTGVEMDVVKAQELHEMACVGGLADSCVMVGHMHLIVEDYTKATRRFRQGCDLGAGEGCFVAGVALLQGKVPDDGSTDGMALVQRGCDLGYQDACDLVSDVAAEMEAAQRVGPDVTTTAEGIEWVVSGSISPMIEIQSVSCKRPVPSKKDCSVTVKLPMGWDYELVNVYSYDRDGVRERDQFFNFESARPGDRVKGRVFLESTAVRVVVEP